MDNVIIDVKFDVEMFCGVPGRTTVQATLENGNTVDVFSYYSDEINFTDSELIGLTVKEALELRHKKDVAYLRS